MPDRADPVEARCPACHARTAQRLYRTDADGAAQHYVLREVDPDRHRALRDHIATLWDGPTCDVLRCTACGFGFARPFVAGDERFYTLAYQRTGYPADRWEFGRTLGAIDRSGLAPGFSALEVGAGDGAFLRRLAPSRTPPGRALATEFSDYGRQSVAALGVRCLDADVRALSPDEGPFDVLCLFQVLEHLDGLDALGAHLARLAAPGAHLFVSVPNAARIDFNEGHGSLLDLPPNHVGRWTPAAFRAWAGRTGWRVVADEVEPEAGWDKARELVTYRYMRRRQDPESAANRIERVAAGPARRALQAAAAAAYGVAALPALAAMVWADGLGATRWVHLRLADGPGGS